MAYSIETARARAEMMAQVRRFFSERNVLEVETPALGRAAAPDCHIDLFHTDYRPAGTTRSGDGERCFLQSSPELFMKRLLANGFPDIYQTGKVFRNGECGRLHNPEFTMLEWYRRNVDLYGCIDETVALLRELCRVTVVEKYSYRELFLKYAAIDPLNTGIGELESLAGNCGGGDRLSFDTVTDGLQYCMATVVEPALPHNRLTVVYHFPCEQAVLSVIDPEDERVARRFEVYACGMELANGFEELGDPEENRRRMKLENDRRLCSGKREIPVDERFFAALRDADGLPPCSGVAVGLDRVLLCRLGLPALGDVLGFDWDTR